MSKLNRMVTILTSKDALYDYFVGKYRTKYIPVFQFRNLDADCITDINEASELIYEYLSKPEPCMISRFGSVELLCMLNYMRGSHPLWFLRTFKPFWVDSYVQSSMINNAGFFPTGHSNYSRFSDLLFESAKQVDLLGSWIIAEERIEKYVTYRRCRLGALEPWFAERPWSRVLRGKKVLVIHPFADTIYSQYRKRELLFENPDVLPEFESLSIVKAVQSIGGECNEFSNWFEALHHMETQMDAIDYDIALIGCGAYGMPLAAHCKRMGKKAVHLGGALQLLFGIKGKRWEERNDFQKLMDNPAWVHPSELERPKSFLSVENGCYW